MLVRQLRPEGLNDLENCESFFCIDAKWHFPGREVTIGTNPMKTTPPPMFAGTCCHGDGGTWMFDGSRSSDNVIQPPAELFQTFKV